MKTKIISIVFVLFPFLSPAVQADPKEDAAAVFEQFLEFFTNSDAAGIVGLFSEDALFWGTGSKTLVQDTDGIHAYFSGLSRRPPGERKASALDYSVVVLSETEVIVSGMWQVTPKDQVTGTPLRVSMALSKRNGQWKIIQFHNSRVPE
ncbi:hypothetical protein NBRC116493_10310 [Aurantivibrio infirmus]